MAISEEIIEHTAKLARLNLSEEEKKLYFNQLNKILGYVEVINSANISNISPTANTRISIGEKVATPLRKDEVLTFTDTDLIMENAPQQEENMFKIPKIIEEE